MTFLILSIILLGLTALERFIYVKKGESWNIVRLVVGIFIIATIVLISYFITDTAIGVFMVSITLLLYLAIGLITSRVKIEWLQYAAFIIGIPIMVYLYFKLLEHILLDVQFLILLLLLAHFIMNYSIKQERTSKQNISLVIGIIFSLGVFFYFYQLSEDGQIMYRQELVAQRYLEEELALSDLYIYGERLRANLRGEEQTVRAYGESGTFIIMTYRNGEIIEHIDKSQTEDAYNYDGETEVNAEGRSFNLEDTPENLAEETVVRDFLYSITGDFDSLEEILADIESHRISIKNEKLHFEQGIHMQSYTIHEITTASKEDYNEVHYGWQEIVEEYKLIEYEIVNVNFTQIHSEKSMELGPQWGDGTFSRSFIVGRTVEDKDYKIYDFGMM